MRADLLKATALALALVAVTGCAASQAFSKGDQAARAGDWDTAVSYYTRAYQANPHSAEYRIALERAQIAASLAHLDQARAFDSKGEVEAAIRRVPKGCASSIRATAGPRPASSSSSRCCATRSRPRAPCRPSNR